jgi:hypothetical protein
MSKRGAVKSGSVRGGFGDLGDDFEHEVHHGLSLLRVNKDGGREVRTAFQVSESELSPDACFGAMLIGKHSFARFGIRARGSPPDHRWRHVAQRRAIIRSRSAASASATLSVLTGVLHQKYVLLPFASSTGWSDGSIETRQTSLPSSGRKNRGEFRRRSTWNWHQSVGRQPAAFSKRSQLKVCSYQARRRAGVGVPLRSRHLSLRRDRPDSLECLRLPRPSIR